jgi:hypothetical protein
MSWSAGAAAIGDVIDGDVRLLCEERCGEMAGRADAWMRHLHHLGLHVRDQLFDRVGLERLAADQHQRIVVDEDDGREILLGVERQVVVERDVRGNLQIVQQQRVAVGRGAGDASGGDGGRASAHVLDDEILSELVGERRRQHARELIGRPPRRIRHDDGDDAAWILLRGARRRASENTEQSRQYTQDVPHRRPFS